MNPWPWFILIILWGACVGSFLNVVIFRLPAGLSIVHPPSRCPFCGHRLPWYENIPVLSWLVLWGRCANCGRWIHVQYPCIEALTAFLFGLVFYLNYFTIQRFNYGPFTFEQTWPQLALELVLIACLLAASMIDARYFLIPLVLTWWPAALAMVGLPIATLFIPELTAVTPLGSTLMLYVTSGAMLGLFLSVLLLQLGLLPRSFADSFTSTPTPPAPAASATQAAVEPILATTVESARVSALEPAPAPDAYVSDPQAWLAHPQPRREVLKEVLFLAAPLIGALLGYVLGRQFGITTFGDMQPIPPALQVLAGVMLGYLVGGALIWFTRILGTLGFGKEAMGLGDVHLLAAIGAVMGWQNSLMVFFVAPFLGLAGALLLAILGKLIAGKVKIIPYGPYLALAVPLVMIFGNDLRQLFGL